MLSRAKKHGAWSLTPGMKVSTSGYYQRVTLTHSQVIFKSYALAHLLSSSLVAYCGTNNFTAVIVSITARPSLING